MRDERHAPEFDVTDADMYRSSAATVEAFIEAATLWLRRMRDVRTHPHHHPHN